MTKCVSLTLIIVAFYQPGVDKSADDVFKRADALMYENKIAMKAQRTD